MEARRVSSLLTFFVKFIIPAVLFFWTALNFLGPQLIGADKMPLFKYLGIVAFLYSLSHVDKKSVRTDGEYFIISDYFRKASVPCTSLRRVSCCEHVKGITITMVFDPKTPFGNEISVLSPLDFKNVFSMLTDYVNRDD